MNEGSGLLSGIGLLFCVGAIVLVAVVAFAMRSLSGRNRQVQRGPEEPRHDDPNIQSGGGFGVPITGDQDYDRTVDRDPTLGSSGFGGAQAYDPDNKPRRKDDDDDQVSSSGGFGRS